MPDQETNTTDNWRIDTIAQNQGNNFPGGQTSITRPLGINSDNVFLSIDNAASFMGTLTDWLRNWMRFKEHSYFLQYGDTTPAAEQVKIWYDTDEWTIEIQDDIDFSNLSSYRE